MMQKTRWSFLPRSATCLKSKKLKSKNLKRIWKYRFSSWWMWPFGQSIAYIYDLCHMALGIGNSWWKRV